jgi:CubicO group peptidase (beta-lactamase class C family)
MYAAVHRRAVTGQPSSDAMAMRRPANLALSNWDLGGPASEWSYAHADQLFPTVPLVPGWTPAFLAESLHAVPPVIDKELRSGLVESAVVLVNGQVALCGPGTADRARLLMSVSKVIASLIVGALADRGDLDYDSPIRNYLPQLHDPWQGCRLIDILDMASGVACPEVGDAGSYTDPAHPFFRFEASLGWRPADQSDSPTTSSLGTTASGGQAQRSPTPR